MTAVSSLVAVGDVVHRTRLGEAGRRTRRIDADHSSASAFCAPLPASSAHAIPGEDQPCSGVAEVVGDLPRLEQRVHRDDDAAGAQHAVVDDGESGRLGSMIATRSPGLTPRSCSSRQPGRWPASSSRKVVVRLAEANCDPVGVCARRLDEVRREVQSVTTFAETAAAARDEGSSSVTGPNVDVRLQRVVDHCVVLVHNAGTGHAALHGATSCL